MKKYSYILFLAGLISALTSCTKAVIQDDTVTPITGTVKYNPDVQTIMFNNCLNCHGSQNPSAGLSLTTYQQVRNSTENGNLVTRMNDVTNPMPPSGILPSQTRAIINKWVVDGYLEN